jgi:hypothetical protein
MSYKEPTPEQRTKQQNKALHLWFTMLAQGLNDAGYDMRKTLKPGIDIPWTATAVKEFLWRPVQQVQLGKESTTELTTKDLDIVYETVCRYLLDRVGYVPEFPSIDGIMNRQRDEENQ